MHHHVVVAGGDARDVWLCRILLDKGYTVNTWGIQVNGLHPFDPNTLNGDLPDIFIGPMTGIAEDGAFETEDGIQYLTTSLLDGMPKAVYWRRGYSRRAGLTKRHGAAFARSNIVRNPASCGLMPCLRPKGP